MPALMQIRLAKACRRRVKGAPMTVTERAAYMMMRRGEAVADLDFMAAFEVAMGIRSAPPPPPADLPRADTSAAEDETPPAKKKTNRGPGRPRKDSTK